MATDIPVPHPAPQHSALDDVLGILCGTIVVSIGLFLLRAGGVVTGGTVGLTLLLDYTTPIPFGVWFVAINLPFFALAIRSKGWGFVLRSALAIGLVSAFASFHALPGIGTIGDIELNPFYAAVTGSVVASADSATRPPCSRRGHVDAAGTPETRAGPPTLEACVPEWLNAPYDTAGRDDPDVVADAIETTRAWLDSEKQVPDPRLTAIGTSDRNPRRTTEDQARHLSDLIARQ